MAAPLHLPGSTSCLHARAAVSQPSLSCAKKVFAGPKLPSASLFANGRPNLTGGFYQKVSKSLNFGFSNQKSARARVTMIALAAPRVPYKTPGEETWRWLDLWTALHRDRIIFIGQRIDENFSNQILATMLYLDSADSSKSLQMFLCGFGGDLTPCLAIYDAMQSLKTPVRTLCVGHAMNMTAFLVMAGEKGHRAALPHSSFEMQPPAGAAYGDADGVLNEANELLRIRDYLCKEVSRHTGQPLEKVHKDLSHRKRWTAREAIEYGLIDHIWRPPPIMPDE